MEREKAAAPTRAGRNVSRSRTVSTAGRSRGQHVGAMALHPACSTPQPTIRLFYLINNIYTPQCCMCAKLQCSGGCRGPHCQLQPQLQLSPGSIARDIRILVSRQGHKPQVFCLHRLDTRSAHAVCDFLLGAVVLTAMWAARRCRHQESPSHTMGQAGCPVQGLAEGQHVHRSAAHYSRWKLADQRMHTRFIVSPIGSARSCAGCDPAVSFAVALVDRPRNRTACSTSTVVNFTCLWCMHREWNGLGCLPSMPYVLPQQLATCLASAGPTCSLIRPMPYSSMMYTIQQHPSLQSREHR